MGGALEDGYARLKAEAGSKEGGNSGRGETRSKAGISARIGAGSRVVCTPSRPGPSLDNESRFLLVRAEIKAGRAATINVDDHSNCLHASIECCACALLSPQHNERRMIQSQSLIESDTAGRGIDSKPPPMKQLPDWQLLQ